MSARRRARPVEDGRDEAGPLLVGEVPPVAEVPRDQRRRPAATGCCISTSWLNSTPSRSTLGQGVGHRVGPAPGVGQVAERHRATAAPGLRLDPEPERRPPSCRSSTGSTRRPVGVRNGPIVVVPDQPRQLEHLEARQLRQVGAMPLVAVQRDPLPGHVDAGSRRRRGRRACGSGGPRPTCSQPDADALQPRAPARAGRAPGRARVPAPPAWTRVALPCDPLASTANWTGIAAGMTSRMRDRGPNRPSRPPSVYGSVECLGQGERRRWARSPRNRQGNPSRRPVACVYRVPFRGPLRRGAARRTNRGRSRRVHPTRGMVEEAPCRWSSRRRTRSFRQARGSCGRRGRARPSSGGWSACLAALLAQEATADLPTRPVEVAHAARDRRGPGPGRHHRHRPDPPRRAGHGRRGPRPDPRGRGLAHRPLPRRADPAADRVLQQAPRPAPGHARPWWSTRCWRPAARPSAPARSSRPAGVPRLKFLALIAAPEGIARMTEAMPDVPIHVGAIDEPSQRGRLHLSRPGRRRRPAVRHRVLPVEPPEFGPTS